MTVFLSDPDVTLYHGDALEVLKTLPAESVHMCVTSPPFYGLRDYGVDGQIGLEETPEQWVAALVDVFREVLRVLRADGTLWLEVGDSYNNRTKVRTSSHQPALNNFEDRGWAEVAAEGGVRMSLQGFKEKDLIGAPWMLAFALRADGWWLRSDIVWARPNPMPESVTDRPTKAHSYIFLLSKRPRYFFDQEAVRELPLGRHGGGQSHAYMQNETTGLRPHQGLQDTEQNPLGRNLRSVWNIATQPYPEAHFATFPEELARRCILAGTSERGCCPECGEPMVRRVKHGAVTSVGGSKTGARASNLETVSPRGQTPSNAFNTGEFVAREKITTGWVATCDHERVADPCVVLDPFVGSGTVPYVARLHGRHAIGIDLNADYLGLASRRLQQQSLFANA